MIIVLLGYMGVGKTTVGKQLAAVLNYNFIDLDGYIEAKEQKKVKEVFSDKGEIYFRKQENKYLKEILTSNNHIVLALGGGTPCYANNMKLIIDNEKTRSFYLQNNPKILAERLFLEKDVRPLIKNIQTVDKLIEFIAIHLFERQMFYAQANYIIPVHALNSKEVVKEMVKNIY